MELTIKDQDMRVQRKAPITLAEARRERQKQFLLMKEERRTSLAQASGLEPNQITETLLGDEKWEAFEKFFKLKGSRCLMFFYQTRLSGACYVFLRTTDKAITATNISSEVVFQQLDAIEGNFLHSLQTYFERLAIPVLEHISDWGNLGKDTQSSPEVEEFLMCIKRYRETLIGAKENAEDKVVLATNEEIALVNKLKNPSELQTVLNSSESLERLVLLVKKWGNEIEQLLNQCDQVRRETDDMGPSLELAYWRTRFVRFTNLITEMRTPGVQSVITALQYANSRIIKYWRELDDRITTAVNEAKDNVKYLSTLDNFFGTFSLANPVKLMEELPILLNAIRMIYSISHYYNSSERVTSLFIKVTNQMIIACRRYITEGVKRIWDLPKATLLARINQCLLLNDEYQNAFHHVRDNLKLNPSGRQFDFSENYIFGKFDTYCNRLRKLVRLLDLMDKFAVLNDLKVEGIETIVLRYKSLCENMNKKNFDGVDQNRREFEKELDGFKGQFDLIEQQLKEFLDQWFSKPFSVERQLAMLTKFRKLDFCHLGLPEKYMLVLDNYMTELNAIRHLYEQQKVDPPIARNMTPIAGKIYWARHLFTQIDVPMQQFKEHCSEILLTPEGQKCVRQFNRIASALVEFEVLYHHHWCNSFEQLNSGLSSSLLARDPDCSSTLLVNFDMGVLESICEARYIQALGLTIPRAAERLLVQEQEIKQRYSVMKEMVNCTNKAFDAVPSTLLPLFQPYIERIHKSLAPGLIMLSWSSTNIDDYVNKVNEELAAFQLLTKRCVDILQCRIEGVLKAMRMTNLCDLVADEAITLDQFIENARTTTKLAGKSLARQSSLVECALNDLVELLKENLTAEQKKNLSAEEGYECIPNGTRKSRCLECLPCAYFTFLGHITQKNTDALIRSIRSTLDAIKLRLQPKQSSYLRTPEPEVSVPLLKVNLTLAIPNVTIKPSIEELQTGLNTVTKGILHVTEAVQPWQHMLMCQQQQQREIKRLSEKALEQKKHTQATIKPLHRIIAEHKEVLKLVGQLNGAFNACREEVNQFIQSHSKYSELWTSDPQIKVEEFTKTNPNLSDFDARLHHYLHLEQSIKSIPSVRPVEALLIQTDEFKNGLIRECQLWRRCYGSALNQRCAAQMGKTLELFDNLSKRLNRPVNDLDDVREQMAVLSELREAEVQIDMTISPIEESYALLSRYDIYFNDGNAERVDSLSYGYSKLREQSREMQDTLLQVQPKFELELIEGVKLFKENLDNFVMDYNIKGPMEPGIAPREASDRMSLFQANFDELYNKYITYSGGEELFGMPITEYPELQRIRRELSLLQKLYQLYNTVLDTVSGYYDLPWADVNIESINQQLLEFQNKCRKLPKALKEWKAFEELSKTIDDFNLTCPLLEMMTNKAMGPSHWKRIEDLTGHKFNVQSDSCLLRNIMEAPLLQFKEDIEDICIAAVKERDIEAKLKAVISDWAAQNLHFSPFKTRGELLLKGDSTAEVISLMEDSLMVLGSLLSNRYNAPYKAKIQEWVQKLTLTSEVLENWMIVQNLWVYLEAVFVSGDIARQLPQEAKRFSNIDKSWQRIMQRAHEIPNVISCCAGDDIMGQMLPHLLEQLELCQKSLTGYLEKKRLVFPRFFFVSDPALLEILGQASDSHTIQAHLLAIFDNTKKVTFDEKVYDKILAVNSQEGETIQLDPPVMAQGHVEVWLGDLLRVSRQSLQAVIRDAYFALNETPFDLLEFERNYPAQVGLLGIQLLWTRDAQLALQQAKYDRKLMQTTNASFLSLLNQLISVTTQDLSKIDRVKFETLVTIHVHQRDIFDSLVKMNIKSPKDFEWLKQSRFYFIEDSEQCLVSITDVNFIYQNEFLGCTDRLVITPLTDRCYITLAQALGMSLGGAPAGPAGTGKTETTKDMGRCLGKYVVVFNCSDQMDYRGLGRIYKGLAQSGSWGCFDEFNRIELPVLSVAAQQIAIVLTCKKERKPQFIFTDGDVVDLDPEFGIFLTMNPGYAGRQELPENLKINFRTVAMMVPDRAIIMRVKLAACGFLNNIDLSKKFFTLYKLCEEQLSKQVHYDFGLRNILSVLRTLGASKRASPQDSETTIVMRVLRDMNLSKLVDEDEPLFMSLILDLFPGINLEKKGHPEVEATLAKQVDQLGLIYHPPWVLKCIQLYETLLVRHGMMTLGPSGAGKTKCINALMKTLTELGEPHREMRMNPKAITAAQMFGRLDVATNDWTDGIFSTLWRRTHKLKKGEHVWLILDGPVDAIWIENLNSVLDDNKTLTLANGDRIPMAVNAKILFEVHNIDNASPATVSRNGMVFMSSSVMTWEPIVKGWLRTRSSLVRDKIYGTFDGFFEEAHRYVTQSLGPKMQTLQCNYIRQAIDIFEGLLMDLEEKDLSGPHLERLITFSAMWALGGLLELDDRLKLQQHLEKNGRLPLPRCGPNDTIFEFVVDQKGEWVHWETRVPLYTYPTDQTPEYTGILVPNVDNTRTDFLVDIIAKQAKPVLLIGEQGTAKTVIIKGYCSKYDPEAHIFKTINFSSATTPNMFQRAIESYVDKRVGSTYGPASGKKMTVFIDDINMPTINEWGDQITNEITRQMLEMSGFYNLDKPGDFTTIVDIQMVAAMNHPGGGRNDIPQRLKRQFSVFNCTLPSNASLDKVFGTLCLGHFCTERGFTASVIDTAQKLIGATRKVWQRVKIKMLPTPAKFHYVFNLRDVSRIWQGMLNTISEVINSPQTLLALWKHECTRVIADRFTEPADRNWFDKMLHEVGSEECSNLITPSTWEEHYFVDFLRDAPEATGDEAEDVDLEAPKIYEAIESFQQLESRLTMFMHLYNEAVRGSKLDLVFFTDAMVHLVKISRVIRTSKGHALLVGVGGSGKQSLTRLASFIAGYKTFQITLTRSYNVNDLTEDLKYLYRTAGQKGSGITFIFTDNDIKDEAFLEYLNNMLSSGEIANLFARDEMDEILQELVAPMKKEFPRRPITNETLNEYYTSRVVKNLHIVLCFSPVGQKFRSRSLKFPGLISGCTMDWFQRWPRDALVAVSNHFLSRFDIVCNPNVKQAVVQTMGVFQDTVAEACIEYFQRFRRQTHVTPKSYLSFINGYMEIYGQKRKEIELLFERMNGGLKKLVEATESVNELSKQLVEKEKELQVANRKSEEVLEEVTVKATAAQKVKAQVQLVKDKAQTLVDAISVDKANSEKKLEAAKPALMEAEAALETIKPIHISTVRKLGKPPHLIMRIMDCVLLLFQKHMDRVVADPEHACPKPSWGEALKLMGGANFLNGLLNFPKDLINEETVELMEPYFQMDDYNMEQAKRVCGDVAGLCSWTKAMASFFAVNKEVLPLKAMLARQENRLAGAMKELAVAQGQLDEKQRELNIVQAEYDRAMADKQRLMDEAEACRRKMTNATALIGGLAGEQIRWTEASKLFTEQINRLVGDVLLATGFLSYTGPFNQEFRSLLTKQWRRELVQNKIPFSEDVNFITMLVDNATLSEWNVQGLPTDELSVQNGLVVTRATRYPLLIDPQGQGKAWIKRKEEANELQITSLNHKYFRTHLEDALALGRPLLIEDVGEELDPALDNILEKNFIKSGSALKVKLGDKECEVLKGFRLYITTKLPNPAYTPEIYARTAVIDFTVTRRGLEDQLLGLVIMTEKKELETERTKLLEQVAANRRKMKELEDNLLYRLTTTEGSLVEDESLIEMLQITKATSEEVQEKLNVAAETEVKINAAREEFRPVAARGSLLYFLVVEMSMVNVMYQTSLRQFLGLFDLSMARSEKSPINQKRIANIIDYLTFLVYRYTARGFYELDKFTFTVFLTLKIAMHRGEVNNEEFQIFIKGGAALDLNAVKPKPKKWIQDMTWLNLVELSKLPQFAQLTNQISADDKNWKSWFDANAPEEASLPNGYDRLTTFHRLLLIRSWCPDRCLPMAKRYTAEALGPSFAEGVITNLEEMLEEADARTPMVCFLSMGSDPTDNIERLAKKMGLKCGAISMGQGQEVHARRLLSCSMQEGRWILLQNCHLGLNFMDELLETVTTSDGVHDAFRCWLTTEVNPLFPISLLQSSIKFTYDPPMGIRAGLRRTYAMLTQDQLEISSLPQWKPLLYGVAFLHTTVQERRKFGPIGWNIPYEFNQADFTSTVQFVQNHLDEIGSKKPISWPTVRYMIGEVQYGGRVTDDYDKRLLNTYAKVWFSDAMFTDNFEFYRGYNIPKCRNLEEYQAYIEGLPLFDSPECFGLHPNADITYSTNTTNSMLDTIVSIQPKDSGGGTGETRESNVYRLANEILEKVPEDYNPFQASESRFLTLTLASTCYAEQAHLLRFQVIRHMLVVH
ncbi:dynein heavy chain 5 axonemal [Clonorchis sinensis]|uniref:Dynein heavy chain 5 axonemal n=2 Tax=Clonorchis sinensis TaxID=79923 RepID=G7Y917_CLOSI|nr:dynein heavy chain 5 axonemal [Clonorchis sinensis]